ELRAVLADPPPFILEASDSRRYLELDLRLARREILGWVEDRKVLADDLRRGVALESLRTRVPAPDEPIGIERKDRVILYAIYQATVELRGRDRKLCHCWSAFWPVIAREGSDISVRFQAQTRRCRVARQRCLSAPRRVAHRSGGTASCPGCT